VGFVAFSARAHAGAREKSPQLLRFVFTASLAIVTKSVLVPDGAEIDLRGQAALRRRFWPLADRNLPESYSLVDTARPKKPRSASRIASIREHSDNLKCIRSGLRV
jgi:hypothetical protein